MDTEIHNGLKKIIESQASSSSVDAVTDSVAKALKEINPDLYVTTRLSKALREGIRYYLKAEKGSDWDMEERCDFCLKHRKEVHLLLAGEFTSICDNCLQIGSKAVQEYHNSKRFWRKLFKR